MQKIDFTKMVASGNDFVVIEESRKPQVAGLKVLTKKICDRKYGVGADGLLVLEKSRIADVKMRIFNADGSEAQMCGNGARCIALFKSQAANHRPQVRIETQAGIIESQVNADNVKIKLTDPKNIKLNMPVRINNRTLRVNFINTGVPHTVIFVEGLEKIDVVNLGRAIRFHKRFAPRGTNADFVQVLSNNSIKVRTYERGVEDETLACGTGAVASALITVYGLRFTDYGKINVHTRGDGILKVYFQRIKDKFKNIWLEGEVKIVYKGVYYV
jgi:diaminopimelate epimerase